eukprot:TRINITY_DN40425_c0_g1_i1.p1 TRINITY_DN40425_c0_g1~~TRINITY_DN40425_c0_g1_i1.p1  ORF type:complete len:517 (+),score=151.49 TRINITY_DN40425_c0_g1_i1:70-1551(+)
MRAAARGALRRPAGSGLVERREPGSPAVTAAGVESPPATAAAVQIERVSRTELALRNARFAALSPATDPFAIPQFRGAVQELVSHADAAAAQQRRSRKGLAERNDAVLRAVAEQPVQVGGALVHFLGVQRDLVRHARLAARLVRKLRPSAVVIPCDSTPLTSALLQDAVCDRHMATNYRSEAQFLAGEREFLAHCQQDKKLCAIVDSRVLLRVPTPRPVGLAARASDRRGYDHLEQRMALVPFLHAAWQAQHAGARVVWAGVPHDLQMKRARGQTYEAEWANARRICDQGLAEMCAAEWLSDWTAAEQRRLSPRAVVSDVNARYAVHLLRKRFPPKRGGRDPTKVLLIADATELHLLYGWARAEAFIGPVAVSQCLDEGLPLVQNVHKAAKHPMFDQVERAVMYDAPRNHRGFRQHFEQVEDPEASALIPGAPDPLQARAAPEHNPLLRRRVGKLLRSWDLNAPRDPGALTEGETIPLRRKGPLDQRWIDGVI